MRNGAAPRAHPRLAPDPGTGRLAPEPSPGHGQGWGAGRGGVDRTPCEYYKTTMASFNSPIGGALDPSDPLPLHEQAAAQLRRAIAEGQAKPGERLPPAMDLAAVLGVNRNTVLRALRLLRDEGLLEFRRGRGITVAGTPEHSAVLARARELLTLARRYGYRRDDLIEIISTLP